MDTTVPPGFKFHPTDQELIWHYLYKKANDKPLPCNAIADCDIYGDNSSWRKIFEEREEETLHFFTRLRNGSSSRVGRATEFGTWKCQSDTKIFAGKLHIGSKRAFSFIEKKKEEGPMKKVSKKTSGWTMQEYRLEGVLMHQNERHSSDYRYVISKISRPRHMWRDEGESIGSLIECEQHALVPVEQLQDNNKFENVEMHLDYNLEIDLDYDWSSYFLEDKDPDKSSFLLEYPACLGSL